MHTTHTLLINRLELDKHPRNYSLELHRWTKDHTRQSHNDEQDARFPLQCRSPDNRWFSSNHVPKMSYGLLRNLRRNVNAAIHKQFSTSSTNNDSC